MRTRTFVAAAAYLGLLALSRALEPPVLPPRPGAGEGRIAVAVPPCDERGPLPGPRAELSLLHWSAPPGSMPAPPLVCLHGSPGSARNFEALAPRLAAQGREVWALDLPGFGRSAGPVGGYSILAHARALLAVLDALGVERAHLLGWSMGGGVALHAADLAPERVASVTLVASIGVQEAEGSGSFLFEHAKYFVLRGLLAGLEHLLPHFGTLSALRRDGRSFALNFWETDQRPLRALLERFETATLILHGREDVLAPVWAAEVTGALVGPSRLVVLDANHFLPILQVAEVSAEVTPFLARHDAPGTVEPRARVEPRPARGLRRLDPPVLALGRLVPWWLQVAALALGAAFAPFTVAAVGGALVAAAQLDFGLVALALAMGALAGLPRRARSDRAFREGGWRWLRAPLAVCGWMLLALVLALVLAPLPEHALGLELPRSLPPLVALALMLAVAALGRRRSRRRVTRPSNTPPQRVG